MSRPYERCDTCDYGFITPPIGVDGKRVASCVCVGTTSRSVSGHMLTHFNGASRLMAGFHFVHVRVCVCAYKDRLICCSVIDSFDY